MDAFFWGKFNRLKELVNNNNTTILGDFKKGPNIEEGLNWLIANFFSQFIDDFELNDYIIVDVFDYENSQKVLLISDENGLVFNHKENSVEIVSARTEFAKVFYDTLLMYDYENDELKGESNIYQFTFKLDSYADNFTITPEDIVSDKKVEDFVKLIYKLSLQK